MTTINSTERCHCGNPAHIAYSCFGQRHVICLECFKRQQLLLDSNRVATVQFECQTLPVAEANAA